MKRNRQESYNMLANRLDLETNNPALSVLRCQADGCLVIVRPTNRGEFAVIKLNGISAKLLKLLPTADRARAYNFAVAKS